MSDLIDLEIKMAFQEKWIAELDEVVRALRDDVDRLRDEVVRLTDQLGAAGQPPLDPTAEKPPHY